MKKEELNKRILLSITGEKKKDWQNKLKEINKLKIKQVAVFLSALPEKERAGLYKELLNSCIEEIPLVHLRNDTNKEDIEFFKKNFKTKFFNIHENGFSYLKKWKGFYKYLILELNFDNYVPKNVDIKKIGGFCIDLSHFKASEVKKTKDYEFIMKHQRLKKLFKCNHLNGYDKINQTDEHQVKNLNQFDYLKDLPNFIFGKIIAIETLNPIKEQLKFKKRIIEILKKKL